MSGYGVPGDDIALSVGITKPTLHKHYRAQLDNGRIKANGAIAQSLYKKATGEGPQSVTAAIFWAKTRMGWKETQVTEHAGVVATAAIETTDPIEASRLYMELMRP